MKKLNIRTPIPSCASVPLCRSFTLGLALALSLAGCHTPNDTRTDDPYRPMSEENRNPVRAMELNEQGADLIQDNPVSAERVLRDALSEDLYCGPAHNNLGVVFLKQGKLYEAASEFEWARKLMPGHPDPRTNLGMTLERAQHVDEAIAAYKSALEVVTEDVGAMQALARAQVFYDKMDEATGRLLKEIAMRGETEEWRTWATEAIAGRKR